MELAKEKVDQLFIGPRPFGGRAAGVPRNLGKPVFDPGPTPRGRKVNF
jgi:hypothetical protein